MHKALQHWAEKAEPPMPGEPCQLVECVRQLREAMEPLTLFTDAEVLGDNVPSHWVKITFSRTSKSAEPTHPWEQSCSQNRRAHARGSFVAAHSVGRSKPMATTPVVSSLTISTQRAETRTDSIIIWQWMPLPGFVMIAKSLWGDNPPCATVEVPWELTAWQGLLVGTATVTMVSTWLHQDVVQAPPTLTWWPPPWALWVWGLCPWQMTTICLHWMGGKTQSLTKSPHFNCSFCWQLLTLLNCLFLAFLPKCVNRVVLWQMTTICLHWRGGKTQSPTKSPRFNCSFCWQLLTLLNCLFLAFLPKCVNRVVLCILSEFVKIDVYANGNILFLSTK